MMVTHPNRGNDPYRPGRTPRPAEILAARAAASLTQTEAAKLVHSALISWQQWEAGTRRMHPATWELFWRKVGKAKRPAVEAAPVIDEDII
jgi:DNA-binding transcriptional regulator YiaG